MLTYWNETTTTRTLSTSCRNVLTVVAKRLLCTEGFVHDTQNKSLAEFELRAPSSVFPDVHRVIVFASG